MKTKYKLNGPVKKLSIEVESRVSDTVEAMTRHMKIGHSELVNMALKYFIATHKDFLPKQRTSSGAD